MLVILKGRVATCKEKVSKSGRKYYSTSLVQGEGTNFVQTVFISSSAPITQGEADLGFECNLKLYDGRISVYKS